MEERSIERPSEFEAPILAEHAASGISSITFNRPQRLNAVLRHQASTAPTRSQLTNQNRSPQNFSTWAARSVPADRTRRRWKPSMASSAPE